MIMKMMRTTSPQDADYDDDYEDNDDQGSDNSYQLLATQNPRKSGFKRP